jgi:hypothetical protein
MHFSCSRDFKRTMLLDRKPYKSTFKLFTFLGFWDEIPIRQRRLTFFMPIYFLILEEVLVHLSPLQAENLNELLDAIKVLPILHVCNFSIYNLVRNKAKLLELLEIVNQIERENPNAKIHIDNGCAVVKKLFQCTAVFTSVTFSTFLIASLIRGQLIFPLYFFDFIGHRNVVFWLYWALEVYVAIYFCISYIPIQEFRCSLLIILFHVMEHFRERLRNLKALKDNPEDVEKELQNCIKLHLQIRK